MPLSLLLEGVERGAVGVHQMQRSPLTNSKRSNARLEYDEHWRIQIVKERCCGTDGVHRVVLQP